MLLTFSDTLTSKSSLFIVGEISIPTKAKELPGFDLSQWEIIQVL